MIIIVIRHRSLQPNRASALFHYLFRYEQAKSNAVGVKPQTVGHGKWFENLFQPFFWYSSASVFDFYLKLVLVIAVDNLDKNVYGPATCEFDCV